MRSGKRLTKEDDIPASKIETKEEDGMEKGLNRNEKKKDEETEMKQDEKKQGAENPVVPYP